VERRANLEIEEQAIPAEGPEIAFPAERSLPGKPIRRNIRRAGAGRSETIVLMVFLAFFLAASISTINETVFAKNARYGVLILLIVIKAPRHAGQIGRMLRMPTTLAALAFSGAALVSAVPDSECVLRVLSFAALFVLSNLVLFEIGTPTAMRSIVSAYLWIALAVCIGSIATPSRMGTSLTGVAGNPNTLGTISAGLGIVAAGRLATDVRSSRKWILVLALAVLMTIATYSRNSVLGIGVGFGAILLHCRIRLPLLAFSVALLVPVLVGEVDVTGFGRSFFYQGNETIWDRNSMRAADTERSFKAFRSAPYFGIGMGRTTFRGSSQAFARVGGLMGYHGLLAETGLVGFGFYGLWMLLTVVFLFRCIHITRDLVDQNTLAIGLALFLAFAALGVFEGYPGSIGNIVTPMMAMISGAATAMMADRRVRKGAKSVRVVARETVPTATQ
jgi:hypothetical protein